MLFKDWLIALQKRSEDSEASNSTTEREIVTTTNVENGKQTLVPKTIEEDKHEKAKTEENSPENRSENEKRESVNNKHSLNESEKEKEEKEKDKEKEKETETGKEKEREKDESTTKSEGGEEWDFNPVPYEEYQDLDRNDLLITITNQKSYPPVVHRINSMTAHLLPTWVKNAVLKVTYSTQNNTTQ